MKNVFKQLGVVAVVITLTACFGPDQAIKQSQAFIAKQQIDKTQKNWKTQLKQPEQLKFTEGKDYFWDLQTTEGLLSIKLMHDTAPMHVSSTIYLTTLGFYDDLIFHRVIPGFMAQGGDPLGNGTGNPGYRYQGEFNEQEGHHTKGILSMACLLYTSPSPRD